MEAILSLDHIYYSYHDKNGETPVINDLSFEIKPGSFTSIVGPSGCGKSTLLSLLCDLIKPEAGTIYIRPPENNHDSRMGYMLQKDNLFEWRSIYKNVMLGLEINNKKTPENIAYVNHLLEQYDLAGFKSARPSQLSGGMRQRAALIRTLALKPDILLLDEPFSALDYQTRLEVREDICSILRKEKKTVILVTHDISEAIAMTDRVLILTNRPAKLLKTVDIEARDTLSNQKYFDEIREVLK
ncbi:ABC transporter ATP-binding protein [Lachnospira eligens]|uniref:Sulfonate/nitrate/taurine transport system ATP-binding protein n=1 Tax=Lachnospira eligens (strain ATCC 27750 / DSM 3376 / VPI C15-48 / C15-B4) TaxID=515620 RepID=C4Z151_LACE2|nr:ABC transporter ATP-binding protein [Lachnospira eligens]ACR72314.1 sulfonate/nitrate/taurine transport system ATP-binding protein [[Eubacterium] eligens ATCC 27750]UEA98606.1 ABC transporter ATP-binding protein [Lachnospira eligens]